LALTPDTPNEAFLREVDENLRRDRMETFARTYGKWLVALVILFLIAVGGYLFWQNKQKEKAAAQSEQLTSIYNQVGNGGVEGAKKTLQPLESANNDVVRALALLTEAAIALESNDRNTALAKYRAISADKGIPDPYRDLALIRTTALEFDQLKGADVVSRLAPLTKPGEPWFGSAGELTAMAYLKDGQKDKAARLFAAIAGDQQVPDTVRNRAAQIAGTLGIDASAAIAQTAQPGSSE
jgi:hypothetical protein